MGVFSWFDTVTIACPFVRSKFAAEAWPWQMRHLLLTRTSGVAQVVSYGISINLVEVTWKSKIKAQFPNPNDYSSFMGNFSTATGTVTFLMMLLSRVIFRKFGWGTAALITPTVLLITGAPSCCLLSTLAPLIHPGIISCAL